MKKYYLLILFLLFSTVSLWAQTTENFETETTDGATTFTDNGQNFTIAGMNGYSFSIQASYIGLGYGWSGTAVDDIFIDNSSSITPLGGKKFSIKTTNNAVFTLKSLWLYLTQSNGTNFSVTGDLTIEGLLNGVSQFTATTSSGYVTGFGSTNGFREINMTNFGTGSVNNSNTNINEFIVTTTGNIDYIAMDAMRWQTITGPTIVTSGTLSNFTSCSGSPSASASFNASGAALTGNITVTAPTGYEVSLSSGSGFGSTVTLTQSSGTVASTAVYVRLSSSASGNPTGNVSLTSSGATTKNVAVTSTITATPNVTAHPTAKTVCAGSNTTFSVTASNTLGYQWQVNTGSGFSDITNGGVYSGATTASLTITGATSGMNTYQYRARVINGSCTDTSNSAALTVPTALGSSVSAQTNVTTYGGSNGAATVAPTGGTSPYSYSWSPSGGTGATATNLTAGTYTVTITDSTVNGSGGCSKTQTVTITQPAGIAASVSSLSAFSTCTGTASTAQNFTVSGGSGLTANVVVTAPTGYEVSLSSGSGYASSVSVTQSGGNITTTTIYARLTSSATGTPAGNITVASTGITTQNVAVTGTVNAITFTTHPSDSAVCPAGNTTFTGAASNATGYQWKVSTDGGTIYNNVANTAPYSGATTATLTITGATAGMNGYKYRLEASGSCPTATSNVATLSISGSPSFTGNPPNRTICTGFNTTFPSTALGATGYQWQVSTDGGSNYNDIANGAPYSGVTTATLTVTGATSALTGYRYRCTASSSCGSTNSNPGTLTVITIVIGQSQTNVTTYGGSNGAATATPSGGIPTYTYSWSPSGGTAATATGLTAGTYTVTVTDGITCQATSANYVITQPAGVATSVTTLSAFATCSGTASTAKNFTVNGGSGLTADVVITAPTGYEVSLSSGSGYAASVSITQSGGAITTTTIYVRMATSASGTMAGNVTVTSTGVTTKNVTVTGLASNLSASSYIVTNVSCFGGTNGTIDLTPSGGQIPYTYNWGSTSTQDRINLPAGTYSVTITDNNGCTGTVSSIVVGQPVAVVSGTTVVTNASCNGGTNGAINLTPSGGTGPYTFDWGGGITTEDRTGLAAGTYSVTITDANSCTGTVSSIVVGQPAVVGGTRVVTNVSCNGGSNGVINLTPTGGTSPYTYDWGGGITTEDLTFVPAGTYSVTITDANGCTGTISGIAVTQPAVSLSGSTVVTNVSCFGGTNGAINLTVSGGTTPYSYNWGGGVTTEDRTGLAAGTYSVTVTDNNACQTTVSGIVVGQPSAIVSGTTVVTNVSCFGGTNGAINLTPTGGTGPYTFNWGGGVTTEDRTGLATGTYSVTITDANGCTGTVSGISITQPAAVVSGTTVVTNVLCNGGTTGAINLTPAGGTGPYTFNWGGGVTTEDRTLLAAGSYSVTITDLNGCTGTVNVNITQPTLLVATQGTTNNTSCNGGANGSATVNVTGGTTPYSYNWGGTPIGDGTATISGLAAGTYNVTVTDANTCQTTQNFTITQPTVLVATAGAQTNVLCNGGANGSATVSVTGGTGTYTYSWAPSGGTAATASGLVAGTYTVTVKDANLCQTTQSFTITQPAALVATAGAQTNVNCRGDFTGSATVSVTGGTGAYTYAWAPSGGTAATASGLAAGTYTVTVTDANGCIDTQSFTITQPLAVLATTAGTVNNVSCNGGANGSAAVNVTGGTTPYTYNWDGTPIGDGTANISGLAAGTYNVTITDANNCQTTRSFTITQPTALTASFGAQTNISCNGGANGSATVSVTGGTGAYTYLWAPSGGTGASATGLVAGTYTVTVKDANLCQTTQSFTITQPLLLSATSFKTDVLCNGQSNGTASVSASGGTPGYTYLWSPSGGTASTATGLTIGNYSCLITDANGCTTTKNFTINQPSVLAATTAQQNATCVTPGQASVTPSGGAGSYTYLWSPSGATTQLVTGLAAGNHSCLITDANGCTLTKNFTITTTNTLVATQSQTNLLCNGANTGSATVIPSGAPGPYTYVWAPSGGNADTASNLIAGNYSVTITSSNGCSIVKNFTITQPSALAATAGTQTNVSCNGGANGSAAVSVTGGTGAYTYVWTPSGGTAASASGLAAGTYTVTIKDANLCQTTQSFTITQPNALVASAGSQTNVSCNGGANGSATVAGTGGTGAYTYVWAPSGGTSATASGLIAGTYTVTVKDANLCQATQSFTITEPAALTATTAQTNVLCNGGTTGSASVVVSGGTTGYTYVWSPSGGTAASATGLTAGNYSVLITDANGCTLTKNFTITQPGALVVTAGTQNNVSCNGGANASATVNVTGGTTPYSYDWNGTPIGDSTATISGLSAGTYTATVTDANGCTGTQSFTITQPAALAVTTSQTNVSCFGASNGSATVAVTGGTGAYTYLWAPSGGTAATASGLAVGTYTVTIKDVNLCQTIQSFTITSTQALAVTPAQTNVSCNGGTNGSATVAVTGGTGTYTYAWAPSGGTAATASGLVTGTYTVTITDGNGCTATQSFTITQPAVLAATATQTNVLCNGASTGTAGVTVSGGTSPYTYLWAPSGGTAATATGLTAGTYTVTIKDANLCQITQSFTITQPTALTATAGAQTNLLCNGASNGSATVNATGGTGAYTYLWAPSGGTAATATGLTAGTYTVTVKDANLCQATQSFTITQPTALTATTTQTNILCFGAATGSATVSATGGTGAYTYAWAPSGGTAATATALAAGTYTCTITDANGCILTKTVTITQTPLLIVNGSSNNISCNGTANGVASVSVTGGTAPYTYSWAPSGGTGAVATGLSGGTYTCTVTDANGCIKTRTFTILEQTSITVTSIKTNILCHGATNGSATVSATGGVPNYSYAWSTGAGGPTLTGLAEGTYTCTVTDALGCSVVHTINITAPDALAVAISQTNVTCSGNNDGSLGVAVTGGTGPYTYAWTPNLGTGATLTGLNVGNYSVTITDANGCSTLRNFSLSQPAPLTATITTTNVNCFGGNDGTALAAVTGGTPPFTYSWTAPGGGTPDPLNLVSGTYTVTITDANGCTFTGSVTINQPQQLLVSNQPQNATINAGGNATYTVNAVNASSFQWQVSEDGTNWANVTNGGTNPAYSGATTNTLTVTGPPSSYNGYSYRVVLSNGGVCSLMSNAALLTIENVLEAVDDDFSETEIIAGTGGIAGDVTDNDLFNNLPVNDADVVVTVIDNDGLFGAAIDADGNLIVPPTAVEGTYTITYSLCEQADLTNCSTAEAIVVVSEVTERVDFDKLKLSVYPNPATTEVFIKIPDFTSHKNIKVTMHDLNGRLVKESNITSELQSIAVTGLESGVYIFRITSDTAQASRQIIINNRF
jgi:hypothetical protein